MLKVYILCRRRRDLTHEQFVAYWRDIHGPLFSSQPEVKKYVRRYVQSRTTGDHFEGFATADVDGVVQFLFDDMDDFRGLFDSQTYRDVIRPDEEKFTDGPRCEFIFTTENTLIG